jgi:predicted nucleic acid-binding OB-fold protein
MSIFVFESLPTDRGPYNIVLCLKNIRLYKTNKELSKTPSMLPELPASAKPIRHGSVLTVVECQAIRDSAPSVLDYFQNRVVAMINNSRFINDKTHQLDVFSRPRGSLSLSLKVRDKILKCLSESLFKSYEDILSRSRFDIRGSFSVQLSDELIGKTEYALITALRDE